MTHHLVGPAEVALILGISRQRVAKLATDVADFPAPEVVLTGGRIWSRHSIEEWAERHPMSARRRADRLEPIASGWPPQLEQILHLASAQAQQLNHHWIGPDHLVMALLHHDCPGRARTILEAFSLDLSGARDEFVASMGDPFDQPAHGQSVAVAIQLLFERALNYARATQDEVSSEHVLLALTDDPSGSAILSRLSRSKTDAARLRDRVITETSQSYGTIAQSTPMPVIPPQWPKYLVLARSPSGKDPRRLGPWASVILVDSTGKPATQGTELRQYLVDRNGDAILTEDGRPVHFLIGDDGRWEVDENGDPVLIPIEVPPDCHIEPRRLTPDHEEHQRDPDTN